MSRKRLRSPAQMSEDSEYAISSLDEMGDGYGFRKIRHAVGVTAFGMNAIVIPPGYASGVHYHEAQEETYFVHQGQVEFRFGDGTTHELGPGGVVRVSPRTHRGFTNAGETTRSSSSPAARTATSAATGRRSEGRRRTSRRSLTAVLLLHGQPGGIRDWDRVVAALGADIARIAEYRPGWDGVNPPLDLRGNAEAAVAKLDRHGVDRAVIVGHSLGRGVAAWIAVLHPGRVRALVLALRARNGSRSAGSTGCWRPRRRPGVERDIARGRRWSARVAIVRRVLDRRLGLGQPFCGPAAGCCSARRVALVRVEQRALFRDLPALEARLARSPRRRPSSAAPPTRSSRRGPRGCSQSRSRARSSS